MQEIKKPVERIVRIGTLTTGGLRNLLYSKLPDSRHLETIAQELLIRDLEFFTNILTVAIQDETT